jgi:peptidoglycan/LPS O-acetylase OafA/YrhL
MAIAMSVHGLGDVSATSSPIGSFWTRFIKFDPLLHLMEFCAGIIFCRLYLLMRESNHFLNGRGYVLYLPGILVGGAVLALGQSIPYPLLHNGLLLPLYGCVIVGFALGGGLIARALSHPLLTLFGNASYSMYILQTPVIVWLSTSLVRNTFSFDRLVGVGGMAVYVAILIALSCLVFKTFEEPLHHLLKRRLTLKFARPEPREALGAGAQSYYRESAADAAATRG